MKAARRCAVFSLSTACVLSWISPVVGSTVNTIRLSAVPYWPAETTGRSLTGRLDHPGTGKEQLYARWVWPETIASTLSLTPVMMLPKSDVGSAAIWAQVVVSEPSCTSMTTTSAPWAFSSSASALTAVTMSVTSICAMPPGVTSSGRCSVTAPTKPTSTPSIVLVHDGVRASAPSAFSLTFAAMYSQLAPPCGLVVASYGAITRLTRSL